MTIPAKLTSVFKQWVKEFSMSKNMPEEMAKELGGNIFTFGSYSLVVHLKEDKKILFKVIKFQKIDVPLECVHKSTDQSRLNLARLLRDH